MGETRAFTRPTSVVRLSIVPLNANDIKAGSPVVEFVGRQIQQRRLSDLTLFAPGDRGEGVPILITRQRSDFNKD